MRPLQTDLYNHLQRQTNPCNLSICAFGYWEPSKQRWPYLCGSCGHLCSLGESRRTTKVLCDDQAIELHQEGSGESAIPAQLAPVATADIRDSSASNLNVAKLNMLKKRFPKERRSSMLRQEQTPSVLAVPDQEAARD